MAPKRPIAPPTSSSEQSSTDQSTPLSTSQVGVSPSLVITHPTAGVPTPTSSDGQSSSDVPQQTDSLPTVDPIPTGSNPTTAVLTDNLTLSTVLGAASGIVPASGHSTVTVIVSPVPSISSGQHSANNGGTSGASKESHAGAIVGGVIGGLALLLLALVAAVINCRRRRASRTAPSAEFMDIAQRGGLKGFLSSDAAIVHLDSSTSPTGDRLIPLAWQSSLEDDERPPAFTPSSYSDPVFEKVQAAVEMREQYRQRESHAAGFNVVPGKDTGSDVHGSAEKSGRYGFGS
ncbi:hypothetical protein BN946_scf184798.g83 [Trametes cinnabarina]|uniref:Uncharacterized protein n=1 Tax=Pycnoporus cinnabarinus TaxID=5643 RepID=A0A060SEG3_PYCCI|nr:hypothetical protein BN946_scf184798.g83 [Trametes cinnabarina]